MMPVAVIRAIETLERSIEKNIRKEVGATPDN